MLTGPIHMGRKGTLLDLSQWTARARNTLGYVPNYLKPLKSHELKAMGFTEAAKGFR